MRFLGILGLLQSSIALDLIQEFQTRSEITQRLVIRGQNFLLLLGIGRSMIFLE